MTSSSATRDVCKKKLDFTPVIDRVVDSEITFAPKKGKPESLVCFLQNETGDSEKLAADMQMRAGLTIQ